MNARLAAVEASAALDPRWRTHFRLVNADVEDAAFIVRLRTDPLLNRHLSTSSADVTAQLDWLREYKVREAIGQEFYFVIICDQTAKGVVRLYDFRTIEGRNSFCWGSWIILPPPVPGLATYAALLVYQIGFHALGFDQSHFEVRRENRKVIGFHLRAGAELVTEEKEDLHFIFSLAAYATFDAASAYQKAAHHRLSDCNQPPST